MKRFNGLMICGLLVLGGLAPGRAAPADDWVAERVPPPFGAGTPAGDGLFTALGAAAVGAGLAVSWTSPGTNDVSAAVWFSPEGPGHWAARAWSRRGAVGQGGRWSAVLPVVDLDEPILYVAATATAAGRTNVSRPRLCRPRELKLPGPTAPGSTFLEGFEEGDWNWRSTDERAGVRRVAGGHQSGHALALEIPAGGRSASVATTRVRGGPARAAGATGFSLWMRSDATNGVVRLVAVADAGTDRQVTAAFPGAVAPGAEWSRTLLRFDTLKGFPVGALDQVIFEFSGPGPMTLWLDDLELTEF